ncbi:MAG: PHP domain-containing protein [Christensenellales bacterium]
MKFRYDFHIHSALSPCADDDMTPVNIVGYAKLAGIDMIAIADHNSILNVEVAMRAGEFYGVCVVPAMELQTAEDIHILCLFRDFPSLSAFYGRLDFVKIKNDCEIFGNQLILDEDDNIVGTVDDLLLTSAKIPSYEVADLVREYGGVAVPAHIDREGNGMRAILGVITDEFDVVEFSENAPTELVDEYAETHGILIDSDAHTLGDIAKNSVIDLPECSADALLDRLCGK